MKSVIILGIIFALILFNIYYPILTTNFNKIIAEIRETKNHNDELAKTDKIITELTTPKTTLKSVNTLTEEFDGESIYRQKKLIDANGCYEPVFSRCSDDDGNRGYKIFTPFQNDCLIPDNHLNDFDAAFAQVDKYLNTLPNEEGAETDLASRRNKCINKPSVKNGIALFGLCNRKELKDRYCALDAQKSELADDNPGLEVEDLQRGLDNMALIHNVCFPDTTINCAPVTNNSSTSTTSST